MGIALFVVLNMVIGIAGLSLLVGALETYFGKPKLVILRPTQGGNVFAFGLKWNSAKEPASIDNFRLKLYNPFGKPAQIEMIKQFEAQKDTFAKELDMGPALKDFLGLDNIDQTSVLIEASSSKDGITFSFEMKGSKFKKLVQGSSETATQFNQKNLVGVAIESKPPIDVPIRSFIADTVPGHGALLKIATNPLFAGEFTAPQAAASSTGAAVAAVANFAVTKVWIEPGCIVCNACEDIYKEVFEVKADTCLIRPGAPLDDGLRIQEAAEACPVEVIKFTKAS